MVSQSLGLQPHVVGGTDDGSGDADVNLSETVMDIAWNGIWINANTDWGGAVTRTAERWVETLLAGGTVHIAEGGQSGFSADVIRHIRNHHSALNTTTQIILVQHSDTNEENTDSSDLEYVRANSSYIKIPDGESANATADLRGQSEAFITEASSSNYATQWNLAFGGTDSVLEPDFSSLNFSSIVELLYILDIGTDQIAGIEDFGNQFFSPVVAAASDIPDPTTRTGWSDSYSVDGQCHCDTSFDHGLSSVSVDTPEGAKPVAQVCADIQTKFGSGRSDGRLYFNTVQCGHDPKNDAADERICPGIPRALGDYTGDRCFETGATWNISSLYADALDSQPEAQPEPTSETQPEPITDPQPEPITEPTPEPQPQPTPEPQPQPTPEPQPQPTPEPQPQPTPEPEPQSELSPVATPEPTSDPQPEQLAGPETTGISDVSPVDSQIETGGRFGCSISSTANFDPTLPALLLSLLVLVVFRWRTNIVV